MSGTSSISAATPAAPRHRPNRRTGPTSLGFEKLLALCGTDDAMRNERYRRLREGLILFFERRGCPFPEDLADEAIDRVARRLEDGLRLRAENPEVYCSGVAGLLYLEFLRGCRARAERASRLAPFLRELAEPRSKSYEQRLDGLEDCLARLSTGQRHLLLAYYQGEDPVQERQKICRELRVSPNTLRLRTFRLRVKVETDLRARLGGQPE